MSSHRASLLTGLRTGGPRSVSAGAYNNIPQTAAVGGQFITSSAQYPTTSGYERDLTPYASDSIGAPMTAPAQDATFPHFQQQQTQLMLLQAQAQAQAVQNAVLANQGNLTYGFQSGMTPEQQAMQLQFEVYKMQATHQQQLQAQILQEAQRQMLYQQQQNTRRRPSEPATASPYINSFGASVKSRVVSAMNEVPTSAGLEGRFPSAKPNQSLNPNAASFPFDGVESVSAPYPSNAAVANNWRSTERAQPLVPVNTPATAGFNSNGVLSGGAYLGSAAPPANTVSPAKHALATSWRRPSVAKVTGREASRTPSPLGSPSASPPTVYVSTPEETSPPQSRSASPPEHRPKPQPLRFSVNVPAMVLDQNETDDAEGQILAVTRGMNESPTSPSTPTSGSSTYSVAREEAARRLYEGLGIGRPGPQPAVAEPVRHVSQPARQPHGPPSGVEDLGARNFATRIRRKAIGGLGVLMGARGRRSSMIEVEAY